MIRRMNCLVAEFITIPMTIFTRRKVRFNGMFFFSTRAFRGSMCVVKNVPDVVTKDSFNSRTNREGNIANVNRRASIDMSTLNVSNTEICCIAMVSYACRWYVVGSYFL